MKEKNIVIRIATTKDAPSLLNIYAHYVKNTAVTFEYEVPSLEEFSERIECILLKYPYIVAEKDGDILGYAYASPFNIRPAYDWTVETSIYVDKSKLAIGIGKKLYDALENILREQNIINLVACIAYPLTPNEFLTKNSAEFHEHLGYEAVGNFFKCGYKFNLWHNVLYMEKHIGRHDVKPLPVKRFDEVRQVIREKYSIL